MRTVNDLVKMFKTSKMTIYKHLHNLYVQNDNLIHHTYLVKGKRYFDDTIVHALKNSLNRKYNKQPYNQIDYLKFTKLQHKIHDLQSELNNKNDKINDQHKQIQDQQTSIQHSYKVQSDMDYNIKKMENLLDQQQQLSLADKKDKKDLKDQIKHLKLLNGPKKDTKASHDKSSINHTKATTHGFWWKLFH